MNKSIEITEALGLTEYRLALMTWILRRTGKSLTMPVLFRLGHLHKGTKTVKTVKGVEEDVVSKAYEVNDTTIQGKAAKVITVNQRVGLDGQRKPLDHANRVKRTAGAFLHGLLDVIVPPVPNKRGVLIKSKDWNEAAKDVGFPKWNETLYHGAAFIQTISPKVVFAADAFEVIDPTRSNEGRKTFKLEISNRAGKLLGSTGISKAIGETYLGKEDELIIKLVAVDAAESAKANKLAKDVDKAKAAEADEAAKQAALDELTEQLEEIEKLNTNK